MSGARSAPQSEVAVVAATEEERHLALPCIPCHSPPCVHALSSQIYLAPIVAQLLQDPVRASSTSGAASTNKFRSAVTGANVPVFGSKTPWSANYTGGSNGTVTVLWGELGSWAAA